MNGAAFSTSAREAVDTLFRRAAGATFCLAPGETTAVRRAEAVATLDPADRTVIVFTMATFTFRITAVFQLPRRLGQASHDATQGITVLDALTEQGNLCCGAINRELLPFFPCMGVSSPSVLHGIRTTEDDAPGPRDLLHYALELGGTAEIHATLHLCAYADIDIPVPAEAAVEATGELEMF